MALSGLHLYRFCLTCGQTFTQSRSDQQFCSRKCGFRSWYAAKKPFGTCLVCRGKFKMLGQRKYCSKVCLNRAESIRTGLRYRSGPGKRWASGKQFVPRKLCEFCKSPFYAEPKRLRRGGVKWCSNECRGKQMAIDMAAKPSSWPQGSKIRGKTGKRPDLDNRYFRSTWEANYARYLNWMLGRGEIAKWEYEIDTFEFKGIKRGSRFYTPDFKITDNSGQIEYHEVKGWMDQKSATKLRRMARYYPKVRVVVKDKTFFSSLKQMKAMLPGWE